MSHLDTAQYWTDLLEEGERYIQPWQAQADRIDRIYSSLNDLAGISGGDRQFRLFWSNIQVMNPAIYARPPVPVVVPKFNGRDQVYAVASELLERNLIATFDRSDINQPMIATRDDLSIIGRGAGWVRYEDDDERGECVHYEHLDRKDFRHGPARMWCHVPWVARRGWLDRDEMADRFGDEVAKAVDYHVNFDRTDAEGGVVPIDVPGATEKCGVWEIWHKAHNLVVWVVEGYSEILEKDKPHLKLEGFFPCPQPAYATLQRGSLIPVPDMLYYSDQLEAINSLTARLHALGDALRVRGFYPGGGEIGDAIEAALNFHDDGKVMIPISNWAAFGTSAAGTGGIIWLPIEQIAQTMVACVEARRQEIEDVYQLIGLSDIMRGQTQADETLGAQQLKQQNGSYRVRDKQQQLVRFARDLARIGAEIMAEKFSKDTLELQSQMDLPTDAEVKAQLEQMRKDSEEEMRALGEQAQQAAMQAQMQGEEIPPEAQQQFEQMQQEVTARWTQQIQQAGEQVTIDQVTGLLRDENLRPYALDIETDSTIYPDEAQEKSARAELLTVFSNTMAGLQPLMAAGPAGAKLAGEMMKFSLAPYRVGRTLDTAIDEFIKEAPEALAAQMSQGQGDEEAMKQLAEAELQKAQAQTMKVEADAQAKQAEMQLRMSQMQIDMQEKAAKLQAENQKLALQAQKQEQEFAAKMADMDAKQNLMQAQTAEILAKIGLDVRKQNLEEYKAAEETQARQVDQAMRAEGQAFSEGQAIRQDQRADRSEDRADRQQSFAERQPPRDGGK